VRMMSREGNEAGASSGVTTVFCRVVDTEGRPRVLFATLNACLPPSRKVDDIHLLRTSRAQCDTSKSGNSHTI
jgi:hypothetical protein